MELLKQSLVVAFATIFATFLFSSILKSYRKFRKQTKRNNKLPIASGAWPIIGHLPLLGGSNLPHKVLGSMADTYGPIFGLKLGVNRAVVVSTPDMARECLVTNDKAVSGRPHSMATELLSYNYAMFGFGPYTSYWRQMRKVLMLELLSNHRINILSHVLESEVKMFVNDLYNLWSTNKSESRKMLVDFKESFGSLSMNIMVRIVLGKHAVGASELHEAIGVFSKLAGTFAIGDALPYLRWLDRGQAEEIKKTFRKLDDILQGWLDEHKKKGAQTGVDQDFMDVMLSSLDQEAIKDCNYNADTVNKAISLTAISGGTDTTTGTLTWAIALLLNNPHVLKKAQEELATQVGKDRQIKLSDIPNLVYLQAIVKETMRLYPAAPLMGPREFIEDCNLAGYDIKAGTRLIVNLHKIFRDLETWEDPEEFRPDRFLSTHKDVDVKGRHFELFPFGAGRRMCPGVSFGLQMVHLILAGVLHAFDFSAPSDAPIEMKERFGLTNVKADPLEVLIAPILSTNAYA